MIHVRIEILSLKINKIKNNLLYKKIKRTGDCFFWVNNKKRPSKKKIIIKRT